jgi:hypothetical protein
VHPGEQCEAERAGEQVALDDAERRTTQRCPANAPVTFQMVRAYVATLRAAPPQALPLPPTVRMASRDLRVRGWVRSADADERPGESSSAPPAVRCVLNGAGRGDSFADRR